MDTLNYLIIIGILLIVFIGLRIVKETFTPGCGKAFTEFIPPNPRCSPKCNCFIGAPFRSQLYSNMCSPQDTNLLREPVQLQDNCYRTLDANTCTGEGTVKTRYCCNVNSRGQRRCKWN